MIYWLHVALLLLTSNAANPTILGFQHHELWQTGRSLVASIRVVSLTSVFSPVVCLSKCLEEDCTLLTVAVTSSSCGERLDCHLTNVTDWLNNTDVYLESCNQTTRISCNTFVATRIPHFYFPLDSGNQLHDLGSLRLSGRQRTLRYGLGSQSGNPFTCTGPSGNPQVKYLLNNLDTNNYLITNLNEQLQPIQGLTFAIWVMFPGSPTLGPLFEIYGNNQLVVVDRHFWFWTDPGQLYYNNYQAIHFYGPTMNMKPGQWNHVAMTWRPGGELLLYWNATQIFKTDSADLSMSWFPTSVLLIGASFAQQKYLQACLAHATVHTETMSQSQLQHLMMTQMALL